MFIMNSDLLVLLCILLGVGTFFTWVAYFIDLNMDDGRAVLKWACLVTLLFGGCISWYWYAANQPWRPCLETVHDIKEVEFPDGSKEHMFTCEGRHRSVTAMFGKVVDPQSWVVRRMRWEKVYAGLSWNKDRSSRSDDEFFLERRSAK